MLSIRCPPLYACEVTLMWLAKDGEPNMAIKQIFFGFREEEVGESGELILSSQWYNTIDNTIIFRA